jgi:hypothetical protein
MWLGNHFLSNFKQNLRFILQQSHNHYEENIKMKVLYVIFLVVISIITSTTGVKAVHNISPLDATDLINYGSYLKDEGYQLHPIGGRSVLSGDVFIVELYCVNDNGYRVYVEMMKIGNQFKMKMSPPQHNVIKMARKIELETSLKYEENSIKIEIRSKHGKQEDEIPILLINRNPNMPGFPKKYEAELVLSGNKWSHLFYPKDFNAPGNELKIPSGFLLSIYLDGKPIFYKHYYLWDDNGKIVISRSVTDYLKKQEKVSKTPIKDRKRQFSVTGENKSIKISVRDKSGEPEDSVQLSIKVKAPSGNEYSAKLTAKAAEFVDITFPRDFNAPNDELQPGIYSWECAYGGKLIFKGVNFQVNVKDKDNEQIEIKYLQ